ncbi:MAG: hypothetical protein JNK19_07145 [Tabrizicola sp.]|nr:hypothetical protein [Tabrizicola sp.]
MQYSKVSEFMSRRAEQMLSGQIEALAAAFAYPLPVYLQDLPVVVSKAESACAMLCLQRLSMIQRHVVAVRPTVTAIDLPRKGRFRVWVDWLEVAIPPEGTRRASAVYYCSDAGDGMKIEMVSYTRLSTPELQPQFAALALSA